MLAFSQNLMIFSTGFIIYAVIVIIALVILIFHYIPLYGQTHIMVYIGVCSLVGSLSVCTCDFCISQFKYYLVSLLFLILSLYPTGHERQSIEYSSQANIFWNESVDISSNLGFCYFCWNLCDHSNELLE